MTPLERYRAVNDEVFDLYDLEQHAEALALLTEHVEELADWDSELAMLAACLHGRLGDPRAALAALTAAADRGGWWDPRLLAEDDDLASLRPLEGYPALLALSGRRWDDAHARTDRSGDVLVDHPAPHGVLVALHGAEEDAHDAVAAWAPVAAAAGLALVAVRSSQRSSPRYRSWPDAALARAEVVEAWSGLPAQVRRLPVVVAGFSAGGRVAVDLALDPGPEPGTETGRLPVDAVLALAPALTPDGPAADRGADAAPLSGAVWVGSDDDLLPRVEAAREALTAAGITVDLLPGHGHGVPAHLRDLALPVIRRALPHTPHPNEDS